MTKGLTRQDPDGTDFKMVGGKKRKNTIVSMEEMAATESHQQKPPKQRKKHVPKGEEKDVEVEMIKPRPVFQSFPKAVAATSIKTVAQLETRFSATEQDVESDSVFFNMLVHWSELDLSEGFGSIIRTVRNLSRSLAMTVFNQDKIFTCLKTHAMEKDKPVDLYLESLYQLMTGLAQDLQTDFLNKYFDQLIEMVAVNSHLKDAQVLKNCFESFNQIIKVMVRLSNDREPELFARTLKIFDHGVSSYAYKLCGTAVSQILRKVKGSAKRQNCLETLFERQTACNSSQLLELTAGILTSSLKTTATSLVVNFEPVWRQILTFVLERLSWEDAAIVHLLTDMIKELKSSVNESDFDKICSSLFHAFLAKPGTKIDSKLELSSLILSLTYKSKSMYYGEEICDLVTSEDAKGFTLQTLTATVIDLFRKIKKKDIPTRLFKSMFTSQRFSLNQRVEVLTELVKKLDENVVENEILPAFVATLIGQGKSAQFPQDSLTLLVETVSTFVEEKKDSGFGNNFSLEFPCVHPDALTNLPNQLLVKLQQLVKSDESEYDLVKMLLCLAVIRPLHSELATETCTKLMLKLTSSADTDTTTAMCLNARVLGSLVCPTTFIREMTPQLMKKLIIDIRQPMCSQLLEYIFCHQMVLCDGTKATNWLEEALPDGGADGLAALLVQNLSVFHSATRRRFVCCLASIFPDKDTLFGNMKAGEQIEPLVQTVRERQRFLDRIAWTETSRGNGQDFEAGFRFILAQFSINFSLVWDPCVKLLGSYLQCEEFRPLAWKIFQEIFECVNGKEASTEIGMDKVDYPNIRSLMLKALANADQEFIHKFVEKNHTWYVNQFLDVYLGNADLSKTKGFPEYINVFKKFANLRSMKRFEEVQEIVEFRCLMNAHANEKTQNLGIEFLTAAYKNLRPHKELLDEMANGKKSKDAYISLKEGMFDESKDPLNFQKTVFAMIVGKLRRTSKEKRNLQLSQRKFILRSTLQLGSDKGIEFLRYFRQKASSAGKNDGEWGKLEARRMDAVFEVFLLAARSCNIQKDLFDEMVEILLSIGVNLAGYDKEMRSKSRKKLLDNVIEVFDTFFESDWTEEQKAKVLESCIAPLLQDNEDGERKNFTAKLVNLFKMWTEKEQYHEWFFMSNNKVLTWIVDSVLNASKVEDLFKQKLLNIACLLVQVSSKAANNRKVLAALLEQLEHWLKTKNLKCPPNSTNLRLDALRVAIQILPDEKTAKKFIQALPSFAARSSKHPEILSNCVDVLGCLLQNEQVKGFPTACLRMMTTISKEDVRRQVSKLLWAKLQSLAQVPTTVSLDDNFLHESYKKLMPKKKAIAPDVFLFVVYFGFSQIHSSDFTQRSAAVLCLRDFIRHAKKTSPDEFRVVVDGHISDIISRGFTTLNDRVQFEFIEMFTECLDQDTGNFGTKCTDLAKLNDEDPDLNFFENMKHIQKHRRGRAMKRLAGQLQDDPDFLSRETKLVVVTPLVKTYIYNSDYISQSDVINAAIECLGALAASHTFKDYRSMLLAYMSGNPGAGVKDLTSFEAAFKKQRVKVLAAVLNAFHFKMEENKDLLTTLINKLLFRLAKVGNSKVEEDSVDIALFVPILKILQMFPEENWLEKNLSNLVVNLCGRLRSRKIEERQHARDVLCEMATLLGPDYFAYTLSILEGGLQRGYQLHILLFTVNAIVSALIKSKEEKSQEEEDPLVFDTSMDKILTMIESELFGNLLEEKKVAALVRATAEAKKVISYGLLERLGCHVSKSMVVDVVNHLIAASVTSKRSTESGASSAFDVQDKLRRAVRSFQAGLGKNSCLTRTDFLHLAYGVLSGGLLPGQEGAKKTLLKELAFWMLSTATVNSSGTAVLTSDELEPFVPHVMDNLEDKSVDLVISCLKFLTSCTTKREVCQFLLTQNEGPKNFLFVITKKCRQYHPMRNKEPYNAICQILRNLLTNDPENHCNMGAEQVKAICLFFQMCLESNFDDGNAIKLLGLLLIKFYSEEASESFVQMLCVASIKAKSEVTFGLIKSIVSKLVKKHRHLLAKTMNFYVQHVTFELVNGRRRAVEMCQHLLEVTSGDVLPTIDLKRATGDAIPAVKLSPYDIKGLFMSCSVQLLNEQDYDTKRKLESLVKLLCKFARLQESASNIILTVIEDWVCRTKGDKEELCLAIGAKILVLYMTVVRVGASQLKQILARMIEYGKSQPPSSKVTAYALVSVLQVLTLAVGDGGFTSEETADFLSGTNFKIFVKLLAYLNPTVRQESLKLLHTCMNISLTAEPEQPPPSLLQKKKKNRKRKRDGSSGAKSSNWFLVPENQLELLNGICELGKYEAREEDLIVNNLMCLYALAVKSGGENAENQLTQRFVFKKVRSIFVHEKFNVDDSSDESRRLMFYKFVRRLVSDEGLQLDNAVRQMVAKQLAKDRKQKFLEEIAVEIEKKIQDRTGGDEDEVEDADVED